MRAHAATTPSRRSLAEASARLVRTVDGLDDEPPGRQPSVLPGLDPRPRGRPPGAQRRGPGRRCSAGRAEGEPRADVRLAGARATRDIDDAGRGRRRASCATGFLGRDHRVRRRGRRACPTTPGRHRDRAGARRPRRSRPAPSPACGCARSRSTTPTSAPATPRADWPADFARPAPRRRWRSATPRDGRSGAHATDLDRTWTVRRRAGLRCRGRAAALAWWLTGRGDGDGLTSDDGELPGMEAW